MFTALSSQSVNSTDMYIITDSNIADTDEQFAASNDSREQWSYTSWHGPGVRTVVRMKHAAVQKSLNNHIWLTIRQRSLTTKQHMSTVWRLRQLTMMKCRCANVPGRQSGAQKTFAGPHDIQGSADIRGTQLGTNCRHWWSTSAKDKATSKEQVAKSETPRTGSWTSCQIWTSVIVWQLVQLPVLSLRRRRLSVVCLLSLVYRWTTLHVSTSECSFFSFFSTLPSWHVYC